MTQMSSLSPAPQGEAPSRRPAPRTMTMAIVGLLTIGLLLTMLIIPVPYAVQGAGPTFDTIGGHADPEDTGDTADEEEAQAPPLIDIQGAAVHPPQDGQLRLTTVVTAGGPGYPVRAANVIEAWWASARIVQPVEATFDPEMTQEERDSLSVQQMITSQEHATVSALTEIGYDVPAELVIAGAAPHTGAAGVVEAEDQILAIEDPSGQRTAVQTYADLAGPLAATPAESTVQLLVEREGEEVALPIVTVDDGRGGSMLGVYLNADFDMPLEVQIAIDNVGGPSAGMMFALGIIEMLTEGDLTGGEVIAGTGTISLDGRVGPIGGVGLKMIGALDDGAEYFLAPAQNCNEVVGNVPDGLQVVAVETLAEAREAVAAIAEGRTGDLPACADWSPAPAPTQTS